VFVHKMTSLAEDIVSALKSIRSKLALSEDDEALLHGVEGMGEYRFLSFCFSDFVTSWSGIENLELVIDEAGEEYDDELECEVESDSDDETNELSPKRSFYKYGIEDMHKIVHLYFETGQKFETIKHSYKNLKTVKEIHR
jgi:hypothetical protein